MELFEAIDRYNEDKNEMALYESVAREPLLLSEKESILKDILGKNYNKSLLKTARDKIMAEQLSKAKSRLAVDKDFE